MITAAFRLLCNKFLQYRRQQQCKHDFMYSFASSAANWEETYVCKHCLMEIPEEMLDKYYREES